jgi:isoamylase
MSGYECWPGVPYPLGATCVDSGVNFAFYSENATAIEVCFFDPENPAREVGRVNLEEKTNHVFHGMVPQMGSGVLYGLRVSGPWSPQEGHRFNPNKLIVDPWAKAIHQKPNWDYFLQGHTDTNERDERDSSLGVPKSVVVRDDFDWQGDVRPSVLWRKAFLYELHVGGFTKLHPLVPEALRGTYAGLAHGASLEYLLKLGVTTVELLPVHESISEGFLRQRHLTNFWGYNTLGYFAPDQRFSSSGTKGQQVREFKEMVRAFHRAGIEVILDVVYNHTCEGNSEGPTLSLRGLDNKSWYHFDDEGHHRDFTGCGNSLATYKLPGLKLVTDSLRYWVNEMHVDGFRFDLATTLARDASGHFQSHSPLLQAIAQDPVLSRVKLIAEPWDVGNSGYRMGEFPAPFAEWNDRYRQTVRQFWRGDSGQMAQLGYRLTGSSDLFKLSGRRPMSSVNFIASHDGFTLRDTVSYERKHNEINGESNRDGSVGNDSLNHGVEGHSTDADVERLRFRQQKNMLATLALSIGTPMLLAGDEAGRTQNGNNNAWCQDNEISYVKWQRTESEQQLVDFTRRLFSLRTSQPVLQRRHFFLGETLEHSFFEDLVWFHSSGHELQSIDWHDPQLRTFGMFLGGDAIGGREPLGRKLAGDSLLIVYSSSPGAIDFMMPFDAKHEFVPLIDTSDTLRRDPVAGGATVHLDAPCVVVFRLTIVA